MNLSLLMIIVYVIKVIIFFLKKKLKFWVLLNVMVWKFDLKSWFLEYLVENDVFLLFLNLRFGVIMEGEWERF